MRIIYETQDRKFRIIEVQDETYLLEDLKGDCFNAEVNKDISPSVLSAEEKKFENLVNEEGVFGYVLEKWNPEPSKGYETIDSCFGFVGSYDHKSENFNHYIVDEMKQTIQGEENEKLIQ